MLFGARRVGKTRLIEDYLASVPEQKWYKGHGEDRDLADMLEACSASRLQQLFGGYEGFFLDEAQSVSNVGAALKLLVDLLPQLKVIVTGSSAFRLDQMLGQPLTGRRSVHYLYPITVPEIAEWKDSLAPVGLLPDLLFSYIQ